MLSKEERKERRHGRVGTHWREGRGRKKLKSWKKISRAWAIGSTKAMRKVDR